MFMGRLVKEPNDILIFGRAVTMQPLPILNVASGKKNGRTMSGYIMLSLSPET
jgi:hypothetical protein